MEFTRMAKGTAGKPPSRIGLKNVVMMFSSRRYCCASGSVEKRSMPRYLKHLVSEVGHTWLLRLILAGGLLNAWNAVFVRFICKPKSRRMSWRTRTALWRNSAEA
jgi:hypothetical protein